VARHGQEARPYAFAMTAALLGFLALLRALECPGPGARRWVLYALTVPLMGWSHLVVLTVLVSAGTVFLDRSPTKMVVLLPDLPVPSRPDRRCRTDGRPDEEFVLTAASQRAPRKDQVRNRRRLLDVARKAFAEQGPDLSIEAVARAAGVGATTFYRHFPTKDDLVLQLLEDLAGGAREVAEEAAAVPDGWEAFRTVLVRGCALDEEGLRLFDALCRTSAQAAERGQLIAISLIAPVVERARGSGRLRQGVTAEDVAALMRMADSASTPRQREIAHEVMLAGLRVPAA